MNDAESESGREERKRSADRTLRNVVVAYAVIEAIVLAWVVIKVLGL